MVVKNNIIECELLSRVLYKKNTTWHGKLNPMQFANLEMRRSLGESQNHCRIQSITMKWSVTWKNISELIVLGSLKKFGWKSPKYKFKNPIKSCTIYTSNLFYVFPVTAQTVNCLVFWSHLFTLYSTHEMLYWKTDINLISQYLFSSIISYICIKMKSNLEAGQLWAKSTKQPEITSCLHWIFYNADESNYL